MNLDIIAKEKVGSEAHRLRPHYPTKNIELLNNPQKVNSNKAYLRRKIEYDKKKRFGEIDSAYSLSDSDKQRLMTYVNKHKKKR